MNKPIKLAVIGAKGAGKTTLMAGYAAVSPNIGGMDDPSRKYLEDQFKAWDNNRWPDPTKAEQTINFRIGRNGGGDVVVSFAEYMGESFSGDHDAKYLERIVGKPEGALLLVNPEMPDFVDTGKRAGFENDAKKVIDYLVGNAGEKTKRPVLALVWTASDTESAKSEEFKSFTKGFRDYVGDRLLCEEFSVSLFGEMSDESFPPGRPTDPSLNTSPRPFEWALKIIKARRIKELLKKILLIAATGLVAALLASFVTTGIRNSCERDRLQRLQDRLTWIGKAPADNADPQSLKNWQADWAAATNKATARTLSALLELDNQFEQSLPAWQGEQLKKVTDDLCKKLAGVAFSLDMKRAIVANFQGWYRDATRLENSLLSEYPAISESDFVLFQNQLENAREGCKDRFRRLFVGRQEDPASVKSKIENVWKEILSEDEYMEFLESILNPLLGEMKEKADTACRSFESKSGDPEGIATDCKVWCTRNADNPYKAKVVGYALVLIGNWMDSFAARCAQQSPPSETKRAKWIRELEKDYDKFKSLCSTLNVPFWNDYATSWPVLVARECAGKPWCGPASKFSEAFPQTITLCNVDVIWKKEGHLWGKTFEGWTISFQIDDRSFEGKDVSRYEGLKDSEDRKDVTLSKSNPNFDNPKRIWPRKGEERRQEVVRLGHQLVLKLHIRECMFSRWKWAVGDVVKDYEVPLCTDKLGAFVGVQDGYLEETYTISIKNLPGTEDTKSTLVFRFYVKGDGQSLGGIIFDAKKKDPNWSQQGRRK